MKSILVTKKQKKKAKKMQQNKDTYVAHIVPTLVRGVTFPDHATVVDHTIIRGKTLGNVLASKGFFDDRELNPKERYIIEYAHEVLSGTTGPDPESAVNSALVRCEMLANELLKDESGKAYPNIFMAENSGNPIVNVNQNVTQTPSQNIVTHRTY